MENGWIESTLLSAGETINITLGNPEILSRVCEFGYNEPRLREGKGMWKQVSDLQIKQKKKYGEYEVTDTLAAARSVANKIYTIHVKIAHIALRNDRVAFECLGLSYERCKTLTGWINQAKEFYNNALSSKNVLTKIGYYNISVNKLKEGLLYVCKVKELYARHLQEVGKIQAYTEVRDKAFDEFEQWISDYIAIARIALEDEPQYLKMLGIVDLSVK